MQTLGVGLIGTGFMGKCHALAWANAGPVLGAHPRVRLVALCDTPLERAEALAPQWGFERAEADWRALIADPAIDAISITTPNRLHAEMAIAALQAGKHVWCEKPMALTEAEAEAMVAAAKAAGKATMLGYNYIRNPAHQHAIKLISEGAIGRVIQFRGWVEEDYQADPDLAWSWRAKLAEAGLGALGDIGSHLVSLSMGVMGPIESLIADMQTVYETRPLADGSGRAAVENEDAATAVVRFANGAQGSMVISRAAWGRKSRLGYEVHGSEGMVIFDQERMNELQLYQNRGPKAEQGFRTILTGPAHPPYGEFCPAPGHQLGFNDLKVIEAAEFLASIQSGSPCKMDFAEGLYVERVIHAIAQSAREDRRVTL
ncbi:Gfo/Idh/MocA family protein [Phaeovulum sp. W22_SRMD_FR3]|uniref:Gfo/Idh/MocA family protein n=1 Tax=Phaeovulum sp. W22_SRMD_FR3 TaxID=3240274 RepID=UPI003F9DCE83